MEEPDRDSNDAPLYDGDARGSDSRNGGWPAPRFLNIRISLGTPSKIEESLTEMSRRHETLRTTFAVEDATPVQIIHPPTEFKLQQLDLTTVSEEQTTRVGRMKCG